MPLLGRTILVTRAREQAATLVALIEARGGRARQLPAVVIAEPDSWSELDEALARLDRYGWLVITSPNGAQQLAKRLEATGFGTWLSGGAGSVPPGRPRVAAVGPATAARLQALGIPVDLVPPQFRAAALPAALAPMLGPGARLLLVRGDRADPALAAALRALGAGVDDLVAYRTLLASGEDRELTAALGRGEIDYVTLTSGSAVAGLLQRLGGPEPLRKSRIAVMGPETKQAALAAGLPVHVMPERASVENLVAAIEADLAAGAGEGEIVT